MYAVAAAITLIVVIIAVTTYFWNPRIVYIAHPDARNAPLVTVIAGVHGNEPAPAQYLEKLVSRLQSDPTRIPRDVRFAFVPRANPLALTLGVRGFPDINRGWDKPSELRRLVDRSQLVIDMHEAWGFERVDPGSLGQTIYAADPRHWPVADQCVAALNTLCPDPDHQWQRLGTLPHLSDGTALDMYCAEKIPYILIEFAGQRDIVPPQLRHKQCAAALSVLLGIY